MKSKIHELIQPIKRVVSKKLIITLAIGSAMLSAQANHHSVLKLQLFDNGIFSVVLDEKPAHAPSGSFTAGHIKPGYHKLKVIRYTNTPYSYYPVKQVVYKGWINIPARSVVFANINCHNQFDIVKIEPKFHPGAGGGCGYGCSHNDCGHGGNGWGGGNGWNPGPPAPPMPVCMSGASFMQLKSSIAAKAFDSSRFEIAQQALSYNYFSAAQVAEVARLFSFESSRLEFAKLAFAKTVDKQNYFMVNDSFTFSSSVGELNEYIAGR